MCGVFGWSFDDSDRARRKVSVRQRMTLAGILATLNEQRGGQSWGSYDPLADRVDKGLGPAGLGLSAAAMARSRIFAGHTRLATAGGVTVENAHPFRFGARMVGMHNGMIHNHAAIETRFRRGFAVDSMHIFQHILDGIDTRELEGYGTIVFTDRREPRVTQLARCNNGELAVMRIPGAGIAWSSEDVHLLRAIALAGIADARPVQVTEERVYEVYAGEIYNTDRTFKLGKPAWSIREWSSALASTGSRRGHAFRDDDWTERGWSLGGDEDTDKVDDTRDHGGSMFIEWAEARYLDLLTDEEEDDLAWAVAEGMEVDWWESYVDQRTRLGRVIDEHRDTPEAK